MKVLMVGVDDTRKGGMLTVVENYLCNSDFVRQTNLCYIPTVCSGSVPKRVVYFFKAYFKIKKELRTGRYDILHMHLSEKGSLYRKGILENLAQKYDCKTLIHMHGADFETWYNGCKEKSKQHIRNVLGGADGILILGDYWESFIRSLVPDAKKIMPLYNAVAVPKGNQYNPDNRHIMFLGALIQRKGILDLLQAMANIRHELPKDCRLILCGDDPDGIAAVEIAQLKLQDRIEVLGWIDATQREEVMNRSAVNVLPSFHEGLPMTILETMAHGIPNISTRVAAIPEAITEGENGFLVEAGDVDALAKAILQLMHHRELRERMSNASYQRAKSDFSLEIHIQRLQEIYKKLAEKK